MFGLTIPKPPRRSRPTNLLTKSCARRRSAGAAVQAVLEVTVVVVAIALGVMVGAALARPVRVVARRLGLVHLLRRMPRRRAARGVSGG